jgi:lipopolysaccharide export system permease protein
VSPTLFRYLLRRYLFTFVSLWAAVSAIFLVTDFVDRAKSYVGPNWVKDAAVLYWFKSFVVLHQLAPGVMLVAAAVMVSHLRKQGELTGMQALAFNPLVLLGPVALVAGGVALALIPFDNGVVARSNWMVDEITATRFHRFGDWQFYSARKQWFRHGNRVFNLQAGDAEEGFGHVSILTLRPDFTLEGRLDAKRMTSVSGTRWRLYDVVDRTFQGGGVTGETRNAVREFDLGVDARALSIRPGKPEQMKLQVLAQQIRAREEVGLPNALFRLAYANRFAYPLSGVPAAVLAVLLGLRQSRRASLTAAFVQGLLVATALWALMVVARSLVLGGRIPPALAAWLPALVLGVGCVVVWVAPRLAARSPRAGLRSRLA